MLAHICFWELIHFTRDDSEKTLSEMFENAKKASELDPKTQ